MTAFEKLRKDNNVWNLWEDFCDTQSDDDTEEELIIKFAKHYDVNAKEVVLYFLESLWPI